MKKIVLGLFALTLTFASIAQSTDQSGSAKQEHHKGGREKGAGYMEKLNLSDAQKTQVKTLNADFRKQMQDLKSQTGLTSDQQKEKRQALAKEHRERIQAILTPEQRKQAEEFKKDFKAKKGDFAAGQRSDLKDGKKGGRGGRLADMTKDLNLTADQSAKIASLNQSFKSDLQSLHQNTTLSQENKKEQMKSLVKKHRSEVESLLTEDQKKELKSRLKNHPNHDAVK